MFNNDLQSIYSDVRKAAQRGDLYEIYIYTDSGIQSHLQCIENCFGLCFLQGIKTIQKHDIQTNLPLEVIMLGFGCILFSQCTQSSETDGVDQLMLTLDLKLQQQRVILTCSRTDLPFLLTSSRTHTTPLLQQVRVKVWVGINCCMCVHLFHTVIKKHDVQYCKKKFLCHSNKLLCVHNASDRVHFIPIGSCLQNEIASLCPCQSLVV